MIKVTEMKDLVPGQLYCLFTQEIDGETGEHYDRDGALVYFTGEGFMDEDDTDRYDDWDYAVPQNAAPNPEYIFTLPEEQEQPLDLGNWRPGDYELAR